MFDTQIYSFRQLKGLYSYKCGDKYNAVHIPFDICAELFCHKLDCEGGDTLADFVFTEDEIAQHINYII